MAEPKQPTQYASVLAADLMRVLDGDLKLAQVLACPEKYGEALERCLHGLHHYLADEDIRSKDSNYRAMQEAAMERLISLLLAGASNEELASESFLK